MDRVAHFVEERFDLVPLKERGSLSDVPTLDAAKAAHEDDHRVLVRALAARVRDRGELEALEVLAGDVDAVERRHAPGEVALCVVVVDSSRASHGVVRRSGLLALAREEVAVDGADPSLVVVDHGELAHLGHPALARRDRVDLKPDPVQRREQPREALEARPDGEEGRDVGQRARGRAGDVGEEVAVPRADLRRRRLRVVVGRLGRLEPLEVLAREGEVVLVKRGEERHHVRRRLGHLVLERRVGPRVPSDKLRKLAPCTQELLERVDVTLRRGIRGDEHAPAKVLVRVLSRKDAALPPHRVHALAAPTLPEQPPGKASAHAVLDVARVDVDGLTRLRSVLKEAPSEDDDGAREVNEPRAIGRGEVDARLFKVADEGHCDRVGREELGRLGERRGG